MIRTVGDNLILTGGRPRGTLYAVYEFLERPVGCHWLDRETIARRPRSSMVLRCIEDHLAGVRHPLELVWADPSLQRPQRLN